MKRFAWPGILLAGAAIWSVSLFVSRYFAAPQPEVNLILSTIAVSVPGLFLSLVADRLSLSRPLLLCVVAYCLGSAAATGLLHSLQASHAVPGIRSLEAALIHAASGTLFVPGEEGGYVFVWANFLWLAMAGLVASIALEALATGLASRKKKDSPATSTGKDRPDDAPRRSLRPRRRPNSGDGTGRKE